MMKIGEIAWCVRKQEVISLYSVQVMEMDFILPIGGIDEAGKIVSLVTDFQVLHEEN